jgi:hypothetical protein
MSSAEVNIGIPVVNGAEERGVRGGRRLFHASDGIEPLSLAR